MIKKYLSMFVISNKIVLKIKLIWLKYKLVIINGVLVTNN
jgi:hypothetical protein